MKARAEKRTGKKSSARRPAAKPAVDPVFAERLAKLEMMTLAHGHHPSFEAGVCAMEAVAWLAGEPHSDAPKCACPVIARAVIKLNDRIKDDKARTELLRPLLPRLIGSRASSAVMIRRGYVAADMAVRVFAPFALERRGRFDLAEKLRACAEVKDQATAVAARDVAREVHSSAAAYAAAAYAAAADAAYAAAAYAATAADAAYDAACDAAADDDAAYDVACDAADADDAAYDAVADDAADDADDARRSMYALGVSMIERMLDVTEVP
jgi:hypothetical protein